MTEELSIPEPRIAAVDNPLLRIEAVVKKFGGLRAVDQLSLDIWPGEFFALLGPSGCGKTTLLRMLAGFETPDEGRILLEGNDIAQVMPHQRPVNMMFQNYALFPHLTVRDNIAFGLKRARMRGAEIDIRVAEMMALVKLEGLEKRRPDQLSGGQKQRVAIARALMLDPKLMLFDEVTSALDPELVAEVELVIQELAVQGMPMIMVTHDMWFAKKVASRVLFCADGVVLESGTPEQLFRNPQHVRTREFLNNVLHVD